MDNDTKYVLRQLGNFPLVFLFFATNFLPRHNGEKIFCHNKWKTMDMSEQQDIIERDI